MKRMTCALFLWGSPPISLASAASKTPARLLPMSPDAAQPAARVEPSRFRSLEKWAEAWRHRTSASGRDPRVARILEPRTLNSLELFSAAEFYPDQMPVVRPGGAVARTLQSPQWGIIAAGNRGNPQRALAWDDSLVTPLRSLGRPENAGARSSVLGFW
jgi:hypothetical protein